MRVVFMGTPSFAEIILRELVRVHDVPLVLTRPDAPSGRGARLVPSAVKTLACDAGIPVLEPSSLADPGVCESIRAVRPDVLVVAAYGMILPADVLDLAPAGAINVHASLLPRWRGAAPIQRAILAGDSRTGVSIMRMETGLDTGPYCAQTSLELDDLNATEATLALAEQGASALLAALPAIADGSAVWTAQDDVLVTYAAKVAKADVAAAPELSAESIVLRVRASSRAAPCRALIADRSVTILEARQSQATAAPGEVICTKEHLLLGAADGAVHVLRLRPEGRQDMDARAWARGVRAVDGARWSAAE